MESNKIFKYSNYNRRVYELIVMSILTAISFIVWAVDFIYLLTKPVSPAWKHMKHAPTVSGRIWMQTFSFPYLTVFLICLCILIAVIVSRRHFDVYSFFNDDNLSINLYTDQYSVFRHAPYYYRKHDKLADGTPITAIIAEHRLKDKSIANDFVTGNVDHDKLMKIIAERHFQCKLEYYDSDNQLITLKRHFGTLDDAEAYMNSFINDKK